MNKNIKISPQELFRQAQMTTNDYLIYAKNSIDTIFEEEGYAKQHPELVGAFINCCALDFLAGIVCKTMEDIAENFESISGMLEEIKDKI